MKIEEIPPLDIFFSPTHKAIVKRKRNKRKLDTMTIATLENDSMDIVWNDTPIDPSENIMKLSQLAGTYATVTIDKSTKVRLLLKEKEHRIILLE